MWCLESLKAGMTCVRWREMTHFSRQALLWHRIRGHPLTSWNWCLKKLEHAPAHHVFMHICMCAHTDTVWCQLQRNISLILGIFFGVFFLWDTFSFTHHSFHTSLSLTLFVTLFLPRVCTVTSASWFSSLRRPMEMYSAGWPWVRSWIVQRRSLPPRNLTRRTRPNILDPEGTGQSVPRSGLNYIMFCPIINKLSLLKMAMCPFLYALEHRPSKPSPL